MLTKGKADYKICVMIAFCTTLHAVLKAMTKVFQCPFWRTVCISLFYLYVCMWVCNCMQIYGGQRSASALVPQMPPCFFERGSLIGPVLTELAGLVSQGAMAICLSLL